MARSNWPFSLRRNKSRIAGSHTEMLAVQAENQQDHHALQHQSQCRETPVCGSERNRYIKKVTVSPLPQATLEDKAMSGPRLVLCQSLPLRWSTRYISHSIIIHYYECIIHSYLFGIETDRSCNSTPQSKKRNSNNETCFRFDGGEPKPAPHFAKTSLCISVDANEHRLIGQRHPQATNGRTSGSSGFYPCPDIGYAHVLPTNSVQHSSSTSSLDLFCPHQPRCPD